MLRYYYEYRNEGDEGIRVVEDIGETHPVPQTAQGMRRQQHMRDDACEHARYRPTAIPATILPWIEPDWQDRHRLVAVAQGGTFAAGLCSCGKVFMEGWIDNERTFLYRNVANWSDIVAISAGSMGIVGLRKNGRVVAAGFPGYMEEVEKWRNIVQVSAGGTYVAGLRRDGMVVICDEWYQRKGSSWNYELVSHREVLEGWTKIVQVSAGEDHIMGVRRDGTVLCATRSSGHWETRGGFGTDAWSDIVQVSAGLYHTAGLRRDGTVVTAECPDYYYSMDDVNCLDVADWCDVVQVCAGVGLTVGLRKDGSILVAWNGGDTTHVRHEGATALSVCRSEDRDNYGYNEYGNGRHDQAILWVDVHGYAASDTYGDFDWLRWK